MRLIDADPLIKDGWVLERHGVSNHLLSVKSLADVPTIDPVHAAGAVYCYECSYWEEDAENNEIGRCLQSGDGKHMRDFCSEGI